MKKASLTKQKPKVRANSVTLMKVTLTEQKGISLQEIIVWAITTSSTLSYRPPSFKSSSLTQLAANIEVTRPKINPY